MSLFGSFWKKDSENTRKSSSPSSWQVGDIIANRFGIYQIFGGEGKSGMGVVYICYDGEHRVLYALKTFQEKYLIQEEGKRFFEREALIWTELEKHPNIVCAYWVQRFEGRLFIVLEYIAPDDQERNTLTHYLGNLTFPEIIKFSIQFCYGMEYAYSKGVDAHRDIKPDNIMITDDKTLKITDFGLAKGFQEIQFKKDVISLGENPSLSIFQSKGKRICGTLPYMAPEQFDGYTDRRSDIYSFGIVLYQMITNSIYPPFVGRTQQEYRELHKYKEVPTVSSPFFPIIKKCLEKDPNRRYQDFTSIREEFQILLREEREERIAPPSNETLGAAELSNKGIALHNLGRYLEAIACYDKAIKIEPRDAVAWNNKGITSFKLGRCQEALPCFDKAIEINPSYLGVWFCKGLAFAALKSYEEALACFDKEIALNPSDAYAWKNKGFALRKLRRYWKALKCFKEAIRLNPNCIG